MYSDLFISVLFCRKNSKRFFLTSFLLLSLFANTVSAADEININGEVALHGYDPVSYFSGKPSTGNAEIYSVKNKVRYLFSSQVNKHQFDLNPERFMPMYGGYCAYGVRMGKKLDIDPLAYQIKDDQLFVLLNRATHKIWQQDTSENIRISDRLWPQIKTKSIKSLQ